MTSVASPESAAIYASVVSRAELSEGECDELFVLLSSHFEGVTPVQFRRDLDEKHWVLRLRREGRLLGFTTVQVFRTVHDGRPVNVIYSGDTITDRELWSSPVLARSWIAMIRHIQHRHRSDGSTSAPHSAPHSAHQSTPDETWYWLLLSSGYRTYRFLPVFWESFWPRHDMATPARTQQLLEQLALERFGAQFDAHAGLVRFEHPQRLRGELADVPEGKRHDPHVAFFLARNAGHADGDELVCLTDLGDHNLTAAGRRMTRAVPADISSHQRR